MTRIQIESFARNDTLNLPLVGRSKNALRVFRVGATAHRTDPHPKSRAAISTSPQGGGKIKATLAKRNSRITVITTGFKQ